MNKALTRRHQRCDDCSGESQMKRQAKRQAARTKEKNPSFSAKDKLEEAEETIHAHSINIDQKSKGIEALRTQIQDHLTQRQSVMGYAQACREMLGIKNPPDAARPFQLSDPKEKEPEPEPPPLEPKENLFDEPTDTEGSTEGEGAGQ
jgi:hypothetical protein